MLVKIVKLNLTENINILQQLTNEEMILPFPELGNATIGEHMRHIIELLGSLLDNYDSGYINYDKRKRDIILQSDTKEAIKILEKYRSELDIPNKSLSLTHNCFSDKEMLETNYFRELLYNLEHSIHHQALIKVALYRLPHIKISDSFGIAPSTLEYRKQCAQ
ncbi:DinB family protein [Flavobacterium proteolyticum]|uniref:DinB family protein n=1 Tax=Flavobacterium proteolyticum TaxID=2911683 RepID=A0ABR9WTT0_9FLAO|nr:DinB family protein [Flavobacterium proteolyticum]MBE9577052.1 DinB family protein [Flavobacterium proteolyticum]